MGNSQAIPIVFVHGIGVSSEYFLPLAKLLSESYQVYLLDLPGYGASPKPKHPLNIDELARVVCLFTQKVVNEQSVLIGQSMGCQVVAHALKRNPSLFAKAVLISPTVNTRERTLVKQALRLLQDTLREPFNANLVIFRNYIKMGLVPYIITAKYMVDDRIDENLKKVATPILLVRGERDRIVPEKWINYLSSLSRHSRLETIPAPHLLHFTHAKETSLLTESFLRQ